MRVDTVKRAKAVKRTQIWMTLPANRERHNAGMRRRYVKRPHRVAGQYLVGQRRDKIVALQVLPNRRLQIKCDCGRTKEMSINSFRHSKSCGCTQYKKLPPGSAARRIVLVQYKKDAAKRGLVWAISDDLFDLLTSSTCCYCGCGPTKVKTTGNGSFTYNGIDRVDNKRGYIETNVVACCRICNRAKDIMSKQDFIDWAKSVASHSEEK